MQIATERTATEHTATEAADVEAVLASDAFAVPEAPPGVAGMAWFRSSVSRFANGADHARRRGLAVAELAALAPAGLRRAAEARTEDALAAAVGGTLDLMPLARRVPVATLAAELGAPEGAVDDVLAIAAVYAPGSADSPAADAAVGRLVDALGDGETGAARIALLVQACDATAGLIGNAAAAALHDGEPLPVDELLAETVRCDPPVRTTRRVCTASAAVGGSLAEPGDRVALDHRAAGFTCGAGLRPCPGREQALALAAGVLAPVLRRCALAPGELRWADSPNLHVLERLDLAVT
jgi:cytochrome P450